MSGNDSEDYSLVAEWKSAGCAARAALIRHLARRYGKNLERALEREESADGCGGGDSSRGEGG